MKKMAFGVKRKNSGFKRWSPKNSFKFCCDVICNNAKSLPECQKPAFLTFRGSSNFPGEAWTPYFIMHQKAILSLLNAKMHKSIPNRMFHWEKITNSVSHFSTFSLSFLFRGERGLGSPQLISDTRRGRPKKNSYEEGGGVIIYYRSYPPNPTRDGVLKERFALMTDFAHYILLAD